MELPAHLRQIIETTHVPFEGLSHPLRIVNAEPDAPPASEAEAVRITVEAVHNGQPKQRTCEFSVPSLRDERLVATTLACAMRQALTDGH